MIGIIDYKAGNSHSVLNACNNLNINCRLISKADEFSDITKIILPGVGSAKATMDSLKELDIIDILEECVLKRGIPFMGICVGLQILFEHSEEGDAKCLGWLKGKVVKFDKSKVRVPQIGWNKLDWKKDSVLTDNLDKENAYLYFVNSYHAVPENQEDILAVSFYGQEFTAMISHDNIYASQCHIEKSGPVGLRILNNFAAL